MFVRSRPSRTRAERPIPGDRVRDAFDRALIGAHGAALDLVAAYLSRAGTLEADESGRTPGILAVTAAEGGPNALCLSWHRQGGRGPRRARRLERGNVSTLDDAVAAFNPLCACPIPNASRLASQAR